MIGEQIKKVFANEPDILILIEVVLIVVGIFKFIGQLMEETCDR